MSDEPNTVRARMLSTLARERESRGEYAAARRLYEESLELNEDAEVRKAYLKLLSILGPQ